MVSRRLRRGGGTTLPGVVARFVQPDVAAGLAARLPEGSIVVSGTNGKTTTTRLLAAMLAASGRRVVHNRAGANLMSGVTTALLEQRGDIGLFEVDEATIPAAIRELRPRLVLCLNLFRDQLDRYGELNTLAAKWGQALAQLPAEATVLLNADDPLLAHLGASLPCKLAYFGVDSPTQTLGEMQHAADSLYCPRCSALLAFEAVYYGHLGDYHCPGCGWLRPQRDFAARDVRLGLDAPTHFRLPSGLPVAPAAQQAGASAAAQQNRTAFGQHGDAPLQAVRAGVSSTLRESDIAGPSGSPDAEIAEDAPSARGAADLCLESGLPGLYNVYNVLAACAAALTLGLEPGTVKDTVAAFGGAFGRTELVQMQGKRLRLLLAKNPVGYNEVIRTLLL
ncbi:MAG TPA: Mur ligase family protein, partial [Chloroflexota bacterium]|nr:Mur ligase family protein [Chloroflexota bacterium]